MLCPRDRSALSLEASGARACRACGGIVLPEATLLAALRRTGHAPRGASRESLLKLAPSPLRCPRDAETMRALVVQGVELDICPVCRTLWLDAGEYDKIVQQARDRSRDGDSGDGDGGGDSSDIDFGDVLDFIGDAVGSVFDGL